MYIYCNVSSLKKKDVHFVTEKKIVNRLKRIFVNLKVFNFQLLNQNVFHKDLGKCSCFKVVCMLCTFNIVQLCFYRSTQ